MDDSALLLHIPLFPQSSGYRSGVKNSRSGSRLIAWLCVPTASPTVSPALSLSLALLRVFHSTRAPSCLWHP